MQVSNNELDINPLYTVCLPGSTMQCGLKYTGIKLQTLQDKELNFLLEISIRGRISSKMGHRYVKSYENNKILYIDANNLYVWVMSQSLAHVEIKCQELLLRKQISRYNKFP